MASREPFPTSEPVGFPADALSQGNIELNLQLLTIAVPEGFDPTKPVPLVIAAAKDRAPNAFATPDGRRIYRDEATATLAAEMETDAYRERSRRRMEASRLVKATAVPADEYDRPVYAEGCGREFFDDVADFRQWLEDEGEEHGPAWCFGTNDEVFDFDLEDALACYLGDNHHEDAFDCLEGLDELRKFYAAWKKKQTLISWNADISVVVILDQDRFEIEVASARELLAATGASHA